MSLLLHAGLFAAAIVVSMLTVASPQVREAVRLTFYDVPPPPPPPPEVEAAPEPAPTTPEPPRPRVQRRIEVEAPPEPTPAPPIAPAAAPALVQPETCSGADCAGNPTEGDFGGGRQALPGERGGGGMGTGHGISTTARPMMLAAGMSRPRRIAGEPPSYTAAARRARVEGTVTAMITIDAQGHVTDVQILRGIELLNDIVRQQVMRWRFSPAMHRGQAVPIRFMQPFAFSLEE